MIDFVACEHTIEHPLHLLLVPFSPTEFVLKVLLLAGTEVPMQQISTQ